MFCDYLFTRGSHIHFQKLYIHWWTGIFVQAIFRKNILTCHSGTKEILEIIDTLFESPIIELLEFGKRMGMTPPYELPRPLE